MVPSRQSSLSSMLRDAWVEIDLAAIENNVKTIKSRLLDEGSENCQIMAVVKSDAYGHGAVRVAEVLIASGATWLGVASVDEGRQIRESIKNTPILILAPSPSWALDNALEHDLDLTVTSMNQLKAIEVAAQKAGKTARIHIKVDTGMHRLGINPDEINIFVEHVKKANHLRLTSVFSHLAIASCRESVDRQNKRFEEVVSNLKQKEVETKFHIASSEACFLFPHTHYDMVRVGLYIYGLYPKEKKLDDGLMPALSVKGRIMNIVNLEAGESAGYNWTWTAERKSRLASIPIGYADGVDRRLSNKISGLLMGKPVNQVGLISMDQMLFDITDAPGASEGDVITLIGENESDNLEIYSWANQLDTITYELVCRLRARLPKIYTRNTKVKEQNSEKLQITG